MVFGRVVSGADVVRQIESLPVDANSRPLQDAKIIKCGELIKQPKGKILYIRNALEVHWFICCSQEGKEGGEGRRRE